VSANNSLSSFNG